MMTSHFKELNNVDLQNFIAFDFGCKTGWCVFIAEEILASGCAKVKCGKDSTIDAYRNFYRAFSDIKRIWDIKCAFFEEVQFRSPSIVATQMSGAWKALVAILFEDAIGVPVTSVKKHIAGAGNADKAEMIKRVSERTGFVVTDHNESDAIAVAYYAIEILKAEGKC